MPTADQSPDTVPAWLHWPVRVVAVAVVLPLRLAGVALTAVGRFLDRYMLTPLTRLCHTVIVRPAAWTWRVLIVRPAAWTWRVLVVLPVGWSWRVLLSPARRLGTAIARLLAVPGVPLRWLRKKALLPLAHLVHSWVLRPAGRAIAIAVAVAAEFLLTWLLTPIGRGLAWFVRTGWNGTSWLARQLHRYLLRPTGQAMAWVWRHTAGAFLRVLAHLWRTLVTPAVRRVRTEILRPTGAAVRSALTSLKQPLLRYARSPSPTASTPHPGSPRDGAARPARHAPFGLRRPVTAPHPRRPHHTHRPPRTS